MQRLAQALSRNGGVLYWQGKSQALVFLETLLREKPVGTLQGISDQSRHGISGRNRWHPTHRSRFRQEASARNRRGRERWHNPVLGTLAGGSKQDHAHGAGRV